MLKCLLKQQWKKSVWLIIGFGVIFLLWGGAENVLLGNLLPYQKIYMEEFNLADKDVFFEQLDSNLTQAKQVYNAVENYDNYNGEIPYGEMNQMDILSGTVQYTNYEMLLWKSKMIQMPGKFTDTIQNDYFMLQQLSERLNNQKNFTGIIENQKETMRRGLRRNSGSIAQYNHILEQLENIEQDFVVADTFYADELLRYLESDWYILVIIASLAFGVFASVNQQKVSNVVLVSSKGTKHFAWMQILSFYGIYILFVGLYYLFVVFLHCSGDFGAIPWEHPIQIITGYENILKDITILQYVLLHICIKLLFLSMLVSIGLYISAMCPNNAISLLITVAICGGLILMNRFSSYTVGLWIGNGRLLFWELCYFNVNGWLVDYSFVFGLGCVLLSVSIKGLTVVRWGVATRKWVR